MDGIIWLFLTLTFALAAVSVLLAGLRRLPIWGRTKLKSLLELLDVAAADFRV
jgi:hypothetical protein